MFRKMSEIFKKSVSEPRQVKSWQSSIGIAIFTLFVLSTLVVNQSVQALNQAAGNYGYYGGSYGYGGSSNSSRATSDNLPKPPTALASSSVTSTTATVSWTAPTETVGSTSLDNFHATEPYLFHYSTSALSSTACSGGTSTTSTSASVSLTGLSASTTYYVNVCTKDANENRSDDLGTSAGILTGTFATAAAGGGNAGVGGGSSGGATGPTYPTGPTVPPAVTPPALPPGLPVALSRAADVANVANVLAAIGASRDTQAEAVQMVKVQTSVSEFRVTLTTTEVTALTNFVTYGISTATVKLGSGERLALVRDQLDTLGRVSVTALQQLATGQKPTDRNLAKEVALAGRARTIFRQLTGRSAPDFKNVKDDLAWNTIMYRIRFPRDLDKERAGITKFKLVFKKVPKTPLEWATVRAWGYALK